MNLHVKLYEPNEWDIFDDNGEIHATLFRDWPERYSISGASSAFAKDKTKPCRWQLNIVGRPNLYLKEGLSANDAKKEALRLTNLYLKQR